MSPSLQTMGFFMSDINFCNTKEQLNHLGEVVTGKVDGSPTGADIDTSTLPYTGQIRKTLPALEDEYQADIDNFVQVSDQVIVDKTAEFDASIANKEIKADAAIDSYRLLNKGPYAPGITLDSKFEYITYNGESYFATNPPYTTTATTPDADGNLFAGGYTTLDEVTSKLGDLTNYQAASVADMVQGKTVGGQTVVLEVGQVWTINGKWKHNGGVSGTIADFDALGTVHTKDFGSDGDSVYAAIDKAMPSGEVYIDFAVYEFSSSYIIDGALNLKIHSDGAVLKKASGSDGDVSLLFIQNSNGVKISGLEFSHDNIPSTGSGYVGACISIDKSQNIRITNNEIYEAPAGITVRNSTRVWIKDNYLHDNFYLWDICVGYDIPFTPLSEIWIQNNRCETSLCGFGIHMQGHGKDVTISGNHTKGHKVYGIMVYRLDSDQSLFWDNVSLSDNKVDDVSAGPTTVGPAPDNAGMGIYLQTVRNLTVTGNTVSNVLQNRGDADNPNRSLGPGAISISGSEDVTCTGNIVDGSGIDGIDIVSGASSAGVVCNGNLIRNTYLDGIYSTGTSNLTIVNNIVKGLGVRGTGVLAGSADSADSKNILINGNSLYNFTQGIITNPLTGGETANIIISNNIVNDIINSYISASSCKGVSINGNICHAESVTQAVNQSAIIAANCSEALIANNIARKTSGSFSRGITASTCSSVNVTDNVVESGIADPFYALYLSNNTDEFYSGNITERQQRPVTSSYGISSDPSVQTNIIVKFDTAPPTTGYYEKGSKVENVAPSSGGYAGWVCTATGTPGAWKGYGAIEA